QFRSGNPAPARKYCAELEPPRKEIRISKFKMNWLNSTAMGVVLASAFTAAGTAPAAAAPDGLYSGGGSFASKVYRDIMDCYGATSGGETYANLNSAQTICGGTLGAGFAPYNTNVEILYVSVGSGNGLKGYTAHNAALFVDATHVPGNP